MLDQIAAWRKSIAAALGSLLTVLTFTEHLPFVPANIHTTVGVVISVLTPIIVWLVPNSQPKTP